MDRKYIVIIALILAFNTVNGQQKWSLRTNAGIASGSSIVDGYYFSFDIGIPLIKSLEISPTFSNASMVSKTFIFSDYFRTNKIAPSIVKTGDINIDQTSGDNLSSISLLLLFKPFELMKNEKLKNHELIIGGGISYNSYTKIWALFEVLENENTLVSYGVKSDVAFEPYYFKLSYNYLFREKLFLGFVAGLNGFDGEAEFLTGVQFGIKFN